MSTKTSQGARRETVETQRHSVTESRTITNHSGEVITVVTESPEPKLPKNANAANSSVSVVVDAEENVPPAKPIASWKVDVFRAEEFAELDSHAVEVGTTCQSLGKTRSCPCRGAVA